MHVAVHAHLVVPPEPSHELVYGTERGSKADVLVQLMKITIQDLDEKQSGTRSA